MNQKTDSKGQLPWSARKMSPKIMLYVALVFVAFMALAYWGFDSTDAVKALAYTALAFLVSTIPLVVTRVEYKLSADKLESRTFKQKNIVDYKVLCQLSDIEYLEKTGKGFKYYLPLEEPNPIIRFLKKHFSDRYSGGIKVEKKDRNRVRDAFKNFGVVIKN